MSERPFDKDLAELERRILAMGSLAEDMMAKAVRALSTRDRGLTQQVFTSENDVNRMHLEIDEKATTLIALHQPVAVDLRFLTAAMKINSELERIADMAVNASQTGYYHLFNEPPVSQLSLVTRMADVAQKMVRDGLDAYVRRDVELARRVLSQEIEENRLKRQALKDLIALIRTDPDHSEPFVDLILLSKNMERIGDHATNIAEDVIYMVLGKDIRHRQAVSGAAVS